MDVNKTEPIQPTGQGGSNASERRGHKDREDAHDKEHESHTEPWSDEDAVEIGGALKGEISPEVQQVLNDLARQIEPLRHDLELAHERERKLVVDLRNHRFLPVVNRRGLEREVTRLVSHLDGMSTPPGLLCVYLEGLDAVRRRFGLAVWEKALTLACDVICRTCHDTDIVGHLGGSDFGLITLVAGADTAAVRGRALSDAFATEPLTIDGESLRLKPRVGGTMMVAGQGFEAMLDAADRDLIRRAASVAPGS